MEVIHLCIKINDSTKTVEILLGLGRLELAILYCSSLSSAFVYIILRIFYTYYSLGVLIVNSFLVGTYLVLEVSLFTVFHSKETPTTLDIIKTTIYINSPAIFMLLVSLGYYRVLKYLGFIESNKITT